MNPVLLAPAALIWLGAVGAILALYLLKPRRRRVEVSSVWLWQGALREQAATTLWQWLKRHVLLVMQVATAMLAVLALARPACTATSSVDRQVVLIVDASASMMAGDGSPTRLDAAREQALRIAAQLGPADRATLLRVTDRAEVLVGDTADRGQLERAIRSLRPAATGTNMADGLEVASALTRGARRAEIYIITDAAFDAEEITRRTQAAIHVVQVGQGATDNQAITSLAARRNQLGEAEVLLRVTNYSDAPAEVLLHISADGEALEGQRLQLPPRQADAWVFGGFPPRARLIEARLERQRGRDLLAVDNVAQTALEPAPLRKVLLVSERGTALERALRALPNVELSKVEAGQFEQQSSADVHVFDGWLPKTLPPGHWLLFDPPSGDKTVPVLGALQHTAAVRVRPSPLLRGVDLSGVQIFQAKRLSLPDWAEEVVGARDGPLLYAGHLGRYRAVVMSFDLRQSNLPARVGFPVLLANAVDWLTGASSTPAAIAPGHALLIEPLPRATRVRVSTPPPAGRRYEFEGNQPIRFVDTLALGAYTVTQFSGREEIAQQTYVAGLIAPEKSDLRPRESALLLDAPPLGRQSFLAQLGVPAPGTARPRDDREWWQLAGVGALGLLLVEWWWFHRQT